jgi:hypothetical protein
MEFSYCLTSEDISAMVFYGAKVENQVVDITEMKLPEDFAWPHDQKRYSVKIIG